MANLVRLFILKKVLPTLLFFDSIYFFKQISGNGIHTIMDNETLHLGWREWVALPELGIVAIKAKVDTGAKTSALHAVHMGLFAKNNLKMVRFFINPIQRDNVFHMECVAPLKDCRQITNSGGNKEWRYIIETPIAIGKRKWPIEVALTNRHMMHFRMLLGRRALQQGVLINPGRSYINGKMTSSKQYSLLNGG